MAADRLEWTLKGLAPDAAITRVVVTSTNGDSSRSGTVSADVTRSGRRTQQPLPGAADDLRDLITGLLGPGQTSGPVTLHGLAGFAALPPVAEAPVLVLQRRLPAQVTPELVIADGLLTPRLAHVLATLLLRGSGVIFTGPPRSRLGDVLGAVAQQLPASTVVAVIEPAPRLQFSRDAIRLQNLPSEARRALGDAVLLIDLPDPPPLGPLAPPVAIAVTALSPEGALARLRTPGTALTAADAVVWAETAPALVCYAHTPLGPRLDSVWEIQPRLETATGLPILTMLLGTNPVEGALVPTGAVPTNPVLRSAWAGGRQRGKARGEVASV